MTAGNWPQSEPVHPSRTEGGEGNQKQHYSTLQREEKMVEVIKGHRDVLQVIDTSKDCVPAVHQQVAIHLVKQPESATLHS